MDYGQPDAPDDHMTVIGRELVHETRRKLQAQDVVAEATAAIARLEERLRRLTPGQLYGQVSAARMPLEEPGMGTRVIRAGDPSLLGLREDDPLSQDWRGGGPW